MSPSFARIVHLGLCLLGAVAVHTTDTSVSRVDAVAASDLADGLADFTESLDALCNGAHRLFCRERVDLGLGTREVIDRAGCRMSCSAMLCNRFAS